jgi:hypothetical protein
MGREIRRVPPDWEHPTQECPHWAGACDRAKKNGGRCCKPLYDNDYHSAAREWIEAFDLWRKGEHPDQVDYCTYYWEYSNPPDEELHRERVWTAEEATAYQIYETVSEGTPVSPVFTTLEAMIDWLVGQGYSRLAAERFAESGWAPSMMMFNPGDGTPGVFANDIESLSLRPDRSSDR